jgi:hypothetical protein
MKFQTKPNALEISFLDPSFLRDAGGFHTDPGVCWFYVLKGTEFISLRFSALNQNDGLIILPL